MSWPVHRVPPVGKVLAIDQVILVGDDIPDHQTAWRSSLTRSTS
jgi:hypothetical protein